MDDGCSVTRSPTPLLSCSGPTGHRVRDHVFCPLLSGSPTSPRRGRRRHTSLKTHQLSRMTSYLFCPRRVTVTLLCRTFSRRAPGPYDPNQYVYFFVGCVVFYGSKIPYWFLSHWLQRNTLRLLLRRLRRRTSAWEQCRFEADARRDSRTRL